VKTKAVRLYGKKDLRLEEFDLPDIRDDQILARIVTDSICMSSYKAAIQGSDHKRVPGDIGENPVIIGHELCGELVEVGGRWRQSFTKGQKFSIQPAMFYDGGPVGILSAPGYSYTTVGGDATYVVIPAEVMEQGCLLPYEGEAFFYGSLAEPMSCIVGTFEAMYHSRQGSYVHEMGIKEGGAMAILAGVGPMGLGAIDYVLHRERKPGLLVVTDIDDARLERAASLYPVKEAGENGIDLRYVNTRELADPIEYLKSLNGGEGYDDVLVFAPVRQVVEQGDALLGIDGCLNFFAGPSDSGFTATMNFYNVHYGATHVVGTSGGNTSDMKVSLELMAEGRINPTVMITHVGGLDAVIDTTLNLPSIPGGKKLIYTGVSMPLTAIADLAEKGKTDPDCARLAEITAANNGLWCLEAERYLLEKAKKI
jgi:L-sorbose 1-phosphate reductase